MRFWQVRVLLNVLIVLLGVSVFLLALQITFRLSENYEYFANWYITLGIIAYFAILSFCLKIVNGYHGKFYRTPKSNESLGTDVRPYSAQCRICLLHPVSKKYHIRIVHNIKDARPDDYFISCGCYHCTLGFARGPYPIGS
jgi:hypothetical protein